MTDLVNFWHLLDTSNGNLDQRSDQPLHWGTENLFVNSGIEGEKAVGSYQI
jgi:hypothetical protein